jgi:oligopeptide/dipeptide ABC transporter ATP-binding protein
MTTLLQVKNLGIDFSTEEGRVPAVRDVSFSVEQGKCTGVIGESGCGKSVTALAIMDLLPSTARVIHGEIVFQGRALLQLSPTEHAKLRGPAMSMVFQDAMSALNPVFNIRDQMRDIVQAVRSRQSQAGSSVSIDYDQEIRNMLSRVGIASPERRMQQYAHELSGGMRQRVLIAMALLCRPQLVIADEPTTGLDVNTQAQIIELIRDIIAQFDMTVMLITHDLSLVAELCDRVVVVYRGNSVEEAFTEALFKRPLHPYTRGLMNSILTLNTVRGKLYPIRGSVPNPQERISGCQFHPRCPEAIEICREAVPRFVEVEPRHLCACFLHSLAIAEDAPSLSPFCPRGCVV